MVAVEEEAALSVAAVVVDVAVANGLVAIEHADSVPVVVAAASAFAHATGLVLVSAASAGMDCGGHCMQITMLNVSTFGGVGGGAGHPPTGVGAANDGAAAGLRV